MLEIGFSYVKWKKGDYGKEDGKENLGIEKTSFWSRPPRLICINKPLY